MSLSQVSVSLTVSLSQVSVSGSHEYRGEGWVLGTLGVAKASTQLRNNCNGAISAAWVALALAAPRGARPVPLAARLSTACTSLLGAASRDRCVGVCSAAACPRALPPAGVTCLSSCKQKKTLVYVMCGCAVPLRINHDSLAVTVVIARPELLWRTPNATEHQGASVCSTFDPENLRWKVTTQTGR